MRIEYDESIPALVRQHAGWILSAANQARDDRPWFVLHLVPQASRRVGFTSVLAEQPRDFLNVRVERTPLYAPGPMGEIWVGVRLSMDKGDARLATEFIEKHYDR